VLQNAYPDLLLENGLNFEAFVNFNLLYLKKNKTPTSWGILKHFGYGRDLKLSSQYIKAYINVIPSKTIEIS